MRKFLILILSLILVAGLALGVSAETAATKASVFATVNADGVAQVNMQITLRLEQPDPELTFPIPAEADHVTLNGTRIRTKQSGSVQTINLANALGGMAGEFNFTVGYNLTGVVQMSEADVPQLVLPILSGFAYPVELLEFSITMPGQINSKPAFSSGYHQSSIEQDLSAVASGNTITGQSLKTLKDHESLTMTLNVDSALFPNTALALDDAMFDDIAMIVCGVLALAYWLLALRAAPVWGEKTSQPPAGFSAGELGSILTLQGAQLNMMVFTWAQLGYIRIQPDRKQRVMLHKCMEMGNERSGFEQRCFKNLFAGKSVVDTTSYRYAMFCKKMQVLSSNVKPMISGKSGNPRLFCLLAAGIGLFGGMALGFALSANALLRWFWAIVLAAGGAVSALHIQRWAHSLFLRDKQQLWTGLILSGIWVLFGLMGNVPLVGTLVPLSQLLAGLMVAFGGRRTESGRQAMKQVLGLRRWLKRMDRQTLQQIQQQDPDYFYTMVPYALALGVEKAFAKQFGKDKLLPCPYISTGMESQRSAAEWSNLMSKTADAMQWREKQMPIERLQKLIALLRK